jgi:hypothetical protein
MIARSDRARSFLEIAPGKTLTHLKSVGSGDSRPFSSMLMEGVELALKKRGYRLEGKVAAQGTVKSAVAELPMSAR